MNFSSDLFDLNSRSPAFSITIEGKDVTTALDARLMSLTLTDNRGFEADQLDLELDDATGRLFCRDVVPLFNWRWGGRGSRFSQKGHLRWMRLSTVVLLIA